MSSSTSVSKPVNNKLLREVAHDLKTEDFFTDILSEINADKSFDFDEDEVKKPYVNKQFDEGLNSETTSVSDITLQNLGNSQDKNSEQSTKTSLKDIIEKEKDHDIECGDADLEVSPLTNPDQGPNNAKVQDYSPRKEKAGRCITQRGMIGIFGVLLLLGAAGGIFIFIGGDKGDGKDRYPSSDANIDDRKGIHAPANNQSTRVKLPDDYGYGFNDQTSTTMYSAVAQVTDSTTIVTTTTTTTSIMEVVTYTMSFGLDLEKLPENTTSKSLVEDVSFVANVKESLATGLGFKPSEIIITSIGLGTRRLQGLGTSTTSSSSLNLNVEFEVVPEDEGAEISEVNEKVKQMLNPTDSSSPSEPKSNFQALFQDTLVAKEKEAGREIKVESMKIESKVRQVVVTSAPRTTTILSTTLISDQQKVASSTTTTTAVASSATTNSAAGSTSSTAAPAPAPVPQPAAAPVPQPVPAPVPQPVPAPSPQSAPAPVPQPVPAPGPQSVPAPVPQPVPQPVPAPVPQPVPQPVPAPVPQSVPAPAPSTTITTSTTTTTTTIPYVRTKAGDAQFLIQATFGPTRSSLSALGGTSYQQWITDQMALPAESHRAYYRTRVNPRLDATKQPTGGPRSRCAKGSRWHNMAITNADVNKQIKVTANTIEVGGVYRSHIDPALTGNSMSAPISCTNVQPTWFANKSPQASWQCTTVKWLDSRVCQNEYSQTDKFCQQSCYDQGWGYGDDDCSTGWAGVTFDGYICAAEEKVGGWVGVSTSTDCAEQNLRGFQNPAIWVNGSPSTTDVTKPLTTYTPGIVLLAEAEPNCAWGDYIRISGKYYHYDPRLELVENTPRHPASYTGSTCPTVAKSFLNEKDCKLVSTCIPLHLQNSAIQLDASSLEKFYTVGGKYVYAITGLRTSAQPCGSLSRWEKLDCNQVSCTASSISSADDVQKVVDALNSAEGWLRDVDISCSNVPAGAVVLVGSDYFKNVHLHEYDVYDFSEWVHAHPGGDTAIKKWTGSDGKIQFPPGHSMDRFTAGSTQNHLTFVGRLGDTINFQDLHTALQNQALANAFHADGGHGYHEVCGSPGESGNDPTLGYHAIFYTVHREGEEVIDYHLDEPTTNTLNSWKKRTTTKTMVWTGVVLRAQDQLRQRAAWALSQIFVVGTEGFGADYYSELWVNYYDIFVRNAFGNFRDLLREITYSPLMGDYLTFKGSTAYDHGRNYPDENYAREIMQLFTIGLWKLNSDGSKQLDSNGKMIPTYDNSHVMNFARVFTGFEEQLQRANYESMKATENIIDPMRMLEVKHDAYPKPDLDGNFLGDGYPLCSDLSFGAFLKQGATYAFLGYSYEGSDILVADTSSALYAALCVETAGSCSFAAKIVLSSTLTCLNNECKMETLHVVKVGTGYYEYIPPTCVHLYFFNGGRIVRTAGTKWGRQNSIFCADPKTIVAGTSCCGGCTAKTYNSMDNNGWTCEAGNMPNMFTSKCKHNANWRTSKYCQLACWQNGAGYDGDDCSQGVYREQTVCSHTEERVSFASAQANCAANGLSICPTKLETTVDSCDYYDKKSIWTPESCSFDVAIDADGRVSSQATDYTKQNKFAVQWKNGDFPTAATCPAECTVTLNECLCSTNVVLQAVFSTVPTKAELEAKLKIGAFAPTTACTSCGGEVKAYATSGSIDAATVFECDGRFYKNAESVVHVGSFSFRNPPNFMNAHRPSKRAAEAEVESLLDHLFHHSNTPVFISYRLIQRFGTSSPSPDYVSDVAQAFRTGEYDGVVYSGKYGDLGATMAAILLHKAVRHETSSGEHGSLREPLLKVIHYLRSMEFQNEANSEIVFQDLVTTIGQEPFQSPSVFNFYQTDFQPSSFSAGVFGPEFQIFTSPWAIGFTNGMMSMIDYGVSDCAQGFGPPHPAGKADDAACTHGSYSLSESATVDETITELDLLFTGGRLTSKDIVKSAYETAEAGDRFKAAQRAIVMTPEFHTVGNPLFTGPRPVQTVAPVTSSGDYKATVMLFLQGGADTFNLIVPYNCPLYEEYKTVRGDIALLSHELSQVTTTGQACSKFGIHHKLPFIKSLYNDGKASFVSNIGALVEPITKEQFKKGGAQSCVGLFSHSDQQTAAQTLKCQEPGASPRGSGGRIADALREQGKSVTSYSIGGTATWSQGFQTDVDIIDANRGAVRLKDQDKLQNVIGNITSRKHNNVYCDEYNRQFANAVESTAALGDHLDKVTLQTSFNGAVGANGDTFLTKQLKQVARLIATRDDRKAERDFFFVRLNGFDLHSNANEGLGELFTDLDDSLKAFVTEIKAQGVFDNTVIATESDFGRSLQSNGHGTDHAWAGHHVVIGGKVKGGSVLNDYPTSLVDGNDQDAGRGRMIPKYPWENMMMPIAEFMGMEDSKKSSVFPNLQNFPASLILPKTTLFNP